MSICVFWQQRNHYPFVPTVLDVVVTNFIIFHPNEERFPCAITTCFNSLGNSCPGPTAQICLLRD